MRLFQVCQFSTMHACKHAFFQTCTVKNQAPKPAQCGHGYGTFVKYDWAPFKWTGINGMMSLLCNVSSIYHIKSVHFTYTVVRCFFCIWHQMSSFHSNNLFYNLSFHRNHPIQPPTLLCCGWGSPLTFTSPREVPRTSAAESYCHKSYIYPVCIYTPRSYTVHQLVPYKIAAALINAQAMVTH